MRSILRKLCVVIALLGIADAGYLTYEHYAHVIPPCSTSWWVDCGKVLASPYSMIGPVPLAAIGLFHYIILFSLVFIGSLLRKKELTTFALLQSLGGFLASLYLVYLQLFVIHAICLYCMGSALISVTFLLLAQYVFIEERYFLIGWCMGFIYKFFIKPILFLCDPENVHVAIVRSTEFLGKFKLFRAIAQYSLQYQNVEVLSQKFYGCTFHGPVGLAAGFDYEAQLTQILPCAGFGFMSVGTITNLPYEGNPKPRLGRLPQSKSLMVNKGYKNLGAQVTTKKLSHQKFTIPVGISIGRTNTKEKITQNESIKDIMSAFKIFQKSSVQNAYFELNISCPNLYGDISFYPPKNLDNLLTAVDRLKLKQPLFIKMPIEKSDKEILGMLRVIDKHRVQGVIFGNLQKNRRDKSLIQEEVEKFPQGNFSGKPTFKRSNELISLCYKKYKKRFIIIGCGGIFSAEDAYIKIKLGASLVQLITGMIFNGPQLIGEINRGLVHLLKKDGYTHIQQAVGTLS